MQITKKCYYRGFYLTCLHNNTDVPKKYKSWWYIEYHTGKLALPLCPTIGECHRYIDVFWNKSCAKHNCKRNIMLSELIKSYKNYMSPDILENKLDSLGIKRATFQEIMEMQ